MANFSNLVITKKGQELLAKIISGAGGIKFTKIKTSDTGYKASALENLNALGSLKQSSPIIGVTRTNNSAVMVEALINNTELTSGYYLRTIGLYAQDPDNGEILYAACAELSGGCYMPAYNGITISGARMQFVTTVGNSDNISITVDPAGMASIELLERKIAEHNKSETAHENLFANAGKKVLSERIRDSDKPDYGLGGGGGWKGYLETSPYSGNAEISLVVNDTEYDGKNISRDPENSPNGTIIIKEI